MIYFEIFVRHIDCRFVICVFGAGRRHVPALLAATLPDVPTTLPRHPARGARHALTVHAVSTLVNLYGGFNNYTQIINITASSSAVRHDRDNRLLQLYNIFTYLKKSMHIYKQH